MNKGRMYQLSMLWCLANVQSKKLSLVRKTKINTPVTNAKNAPRVRSIFSFHIICTSLLSFCQHPIGQYGQDLLHKDMHFLLVMFIVQRTILGHHMLIDSLIQSLQKFG